MSEHDETLADIAAEMRFHAQLNIDAEKDKPEFGILTAEGRIVKNYADRIEAAHKREVEKLNSVIQATVSRSDAEIDRLRRGATERRKQVGNAAAMREALVKIRDSISGDEDVNSVELANIAYTALEEPPRNCDVYKTPEESIRMFESYIRESGKVGFINPFTEVVKWLFAPATGQKGDGDGSK